MHVSYCPLLTRKRRYRLCWEGTVACRWHFVHDCFVCVCVCVCIVSVCPMCVHWQPALWPTMLHLTQSLSTRLLLFLMLNQKHATELWASAMSLTSTGSHPPDINITPPSSSTLNSVRRGFFLNLFVSVYYMFLYIICFCISSVSSCICVVLFLFKSFFWAFYQ